jgi:hypothetical protein
MIARGGERKPAFPPVMSPKVVPIIARFYQLISCMLNKAIFDVGACLILCSFLFIDL